MDQLSGLKAHSLVVADTGDFESIKTFQPRDATTNPSLLLKAAAMPEYADLVDRTLDGVRKDGGDIDAALDRLAVAFGREILEIVPGRVSTEVDARLSFDTDATVAKARHLISLYEAAGVDRDRILIKIASTWEGIKAAEELEKEGIRCNLTLLFSMAQAVACAEANVQLISPFVGRIYDWYKAKNGVDYTGAEDPGVISVTQIFHYYKQFGYKTEIMGASFRNVSQIIELSGCDLLTISPGLLQQLRDTTGEVELKLSKANADANQIERISLDEKGFRFMLNEDAMATEKTAEGIRQFSADIVKLEDLISARI